MSNSIPASEYYKIKENPVDEIELILIEKYFRSINPLWIEKFKLNKFQKFLSKKEYVYLINKYGKYDHTLLDD